VATRSASWSRPADGVGAAAALAVGLLLLVASWTALHGWFFDDDQIVDTPVYWKYGTKIAYGDVPYKDFRVEYPPAALPIFAAPEIPDGPILYAQYRDRFEYLSLAAFALALTGAAFALRGLRAGLGRSTAALSFAGLAPLALGSVCLTRFDAWPAAICVCAIAAIVSGRSRLGLAGLGLGVATKLWPGVVAPFAVAYVWRREGRRAALVSAGWFLWVVLAWFATFFVVSPGGMWHSISGQLTRPLQIESLGSAFLLAAHQLGAALAMRSSHGSQNLDGTGPAVIAVVLTVVQLGVLAALFAVFARRRTPSPDDFVRYAAAAVVAFVALGKVLSPQFLIWLVPLVPLVRGRRGLAATALLGAACVLTQTWFPFRYWDLALAFDPAASWLVVVRDLVLVALLAVLVTPRRERARRPSLAP
jgi:uncharacterized membrane protein